MALLPISPYITWKGISTNSAIPSFSRPDLSISGPEFKANPIKHWRKQLIPSENSGNRNRRAGIGMTFDTPGSAIYLGNVNENTSCLLNGSADTTGLKENIIKFNNTNFVYNDDDGNQVGLCGSCNSEINYKIKPATTILKKNYYCDRKSYMRSRCILYEQKLTALPVPDITYTDRNGKLLQITDITATRQTQNCSSCSTPDQGEQCKTIYKPNNSQYYQQGAVDSSDRITRLKLNTVNKNAASYKELFGSSASRYLGMASTPYFIKSKYEKCVPYRKTGNNSNICNPT